MNMTDTSDTATSFPPLSVLELATVEKGRGANAAFAAVAEIAGRAEDLGFRRLWLAEHHGYRSVGSVAPAVLAAHLGSVTSHIRIGSGGVLLPHHAPIVVAEQFATLTALYPGRIDLGIGRGPGTTDRRMLKALGNAGGFSVDATYEADLIELLSYLSGEAELRHLTGFAEPPVPWLLSSSISGSELAGRRGLPLAFGHHIRPDNTVNAITRYREQFRPSRWCEQPHVMVSVETLCASTDAEAEEWGAPAALTMAAALQGRGPDAPLLPPQEVDIESIPPETAERLAALRATQAHGSPQSVAARLAEITARTGADELILSTPVYDPARRAQSLERAGAAARPSTSTTNGAPEVR
jgi:luciferase family oxidoreductase group 1